MEAGNALDSDTIIENGLFLFDVSNTFYWYSHRLGQLRGCFVFELNLFGPFDCCRPLRVISLLGLASLKEFKKFFLVRHRKAGLLLFIRLLFLNFEVQYLDGFAWSHILSFLFFLLFSRINLSFFLFILLRPLKLLS